jgi:arylsulfatase A-like enzyme
VTLPELLGAAGYETHLSGLQHVAPDASRLGFDHRYSGDHDAEETTAAATEIFEAAEAGPIYAQFGFSEVHRPLEQGTDDEEGVYVPPYVEATDEMCEDFARYQASVTYLDERVGEIIRALEESGHREETIVVFAADHGIPYPGAKWWCRSAGVEVATIADGPGPAFESDGPEEALLSNVDVVPTLLDALDLPVPDAVEGSSFRPYLAGEVEDPPREAAFTQFQGSSSRGIVTEEYNLIRNFGAGRDVEYPVEASPSSRGPDLDSSADPLPYAQLYDRAADPHELDDVAGENGAVVADLSDRLLEWMVDVEDPILRGPIATPYYDRAIDHLLTGGTRTGTAAPDMD